VKRIPLLNESLRYIYSKRRKMLTEWLKDLPVHFGCLYARECNRFVQCLLYNYTLLIYIMYFGAFVILLQDEARHERPILS
jgi:hypothetical protein